MNLLVGLQGIAQILNIIILYPFCITIHMIPIVQTVPTKNVIIIEK